MTVPELYRAARAFSYSFSENYREDLVQDAVISGWLATLDGLNNRSYILRNIRMKLIDRYRYYSLRVMDDLDGLGDSVFGTYEDAYFSLPLRGMEREVAEKMIELDYCLADCARALNVSEYRVEGAWKRAVVKLREVYSC